MMTMKVEILDKLTKVLFCSHLLDVSEFGNEMNSLFDSHNNSIDNGPLSSIAEENNSKNPPSGNSRLMHLRN